VRALAPPSPRAYAPLGLALAISAVAPLVRLTWTLEVTVLVAVYAAVALWSRLRTRPTASFLWALLVYGFVMLVGAHWTYGHAPPGEWLREVLSLTRNPWDRVGHLFQGAVPALFVLGLVPRGTSFRRRLALALAAGLVTALTFELLEALVVHIAPGAAHFEQTQGDPHDSLFDVLCAGLGASLALLAPPQTPSAPLPLANRREGSA
jgi:putative membrane protein